MFSVVGTAQIESSLQPSEFSPVKWLEGIKVDDSAPEYLLVSQRRRGYLDDADFSTLMVKIGDLGGGMMHHPPCQRKNLTNILTSCVEWSMQSVASNTDSLPCT